MKRIVSLLCVALLSLPLLAGELKWGTDLPAALAQAKKDGKVVLMDFTGSDWCGWCKKLDKEVFSTPEFAEYAKKNLVLVEVDFPANKKQSAELQKANEALKNKYGAEGFPTIVVVSGDGKQLWKQVGYMAGGT